MLARNIRRSLLAAAVGLAVLPAGALAVPPANDGYLQSIAVNARGTPLTPEPRKDQQDTTEATVQGDLFSPPGAGGGVERTDCRGGFFGGTVWYDFHPPVNGVAEIQATGYDTVVGVYEFNPTSAAIGARLDCSSVPGTEDMFVPVEGGKSYTIQIGGAAGATGLLEFTFEFFADRDRDGVFDVLDDCDTVAAMTRSGCPTELRAVPTLRATPTGNGIQVRSLAVDAPRGSRVRVRCRRGCSFNQTRTAGRSATRFSGLRNRRLPSGARLEVFVTQAGAIGSYVSYRVTRGNFRRTTRCLRPGSTTPRRSCR